MQWQFFYEFEGSLTNRIKFGFYWGFLSVGDTFSLLGHHDGKRKVFKDGKSLKDLLDFDRKNQCFDCSGSPF